MESVLAEEKIILGHLLLALIEQIVDANEGGQVFLLRALLVGKWTADDGSVAFLKVAAVSRTAKGVQNVPGKVVLGGDHLNGSHESH